MKLFDSMTVVDYRKPAEDLVVDLFNFKYGTSYSASQFSFGVPVASSIPSRDTDVTMFGNQDQGVKGSLVLHYNRVPMTAWLEGKTNFIFREDETKVSDLLPKINEKFGVFIKSCDIIDANLPTLNPGVPSDAKDFALTLKAGHLVHFGSIVLSLRQTLVDIGEEYGDTILNGFEMHSGD